MPPSGTEATPSIDLDSLTVNGIQEGLCASAKKGAEPGGVEFLKAALFLGIDCGGQWTRKRRY
jgi:hypothetical protein